MPSSFARHSAAMALFEELLRQLRESAPTERGRKGEELAAIIAQVDEARARFEALGNPQSGSSG